MQDIDRAADVARLNRLYFPASRASLKDKPYFDEMLDELLLQVQRPSTNP